MERFVGALSVTLMLLGLATVAQVQSPKQGDLAVVVDAGLITPSSGRDFDSNAVLSRAELASILVKTFRLDQRQPRQSTATPLQDVPRSHWAYKDIQTVVQIGIMEGYREGMFFPDHRVTRAEAFSILVQAYGMFPFPEQTANAVLARYSDAAQVPGWAKKSMAIALHEGLVHVKHGDRIDPLSPMTRADVAYALSMHPQQEGQSGLWKFESPS